jgi:hypothetical protein
MLFIVRKIDEGWWEAELNGYRGMIPANYVEEVPYSPLGAPPPVSRANKARSLHRPVIA